MDRFGICRLDYCAARTDRNYPIIALSATDMTSREFSITRATNDGITLAGIRAKFAVSIHRPVREARRTRGELNHAYNQVTIVDDN